MVQLPILNASGVGGKTNSVSVSAPVYTQTFTDQGATFEARDIVSDGTFPNGKPWVVLSALPTSGVIDTLPLEGLITRTYPDSTTFLGATHGMSVNPGRAVDAFNLHGEPYATLAERQKGNSWGAGQGYDEIDDGSDDPGGGDEHDYFTLLNVAGNLQQNGTLVKATSHINLPTNNGRPAVSQLGVLHIMSSAPASGEFAPGYASDDNSVQWRGTNWT